MPAAHEVDSLWLRCRSSGLLHATGCGLGAIEQLRRITTDGLAELVDETEDRKMLRCREAAVGARKGQTSDLCFYEMGFQQHLNSQALGESQDEAQDPKLGGVGLGSGETSARQEQRRDGYNMFLIG